MAVDYASSSSVAEATAANATYTAPSGIVNGDLLLIWHFEFNTGSQPTPTAPSGFSLVPGTWPMHPQANDSAWLWYKIASGESGNYTVTHTSCVRRGIMVRVTGNDTTTPFSPNPTLNSGQSATTTTWTTLTTTVDNCLILAFGADYNNGSADLTPPSGTTPTFTERVDIGGEYLATGVLATAGATGGKTMTNNNNSSVDSYYGVLVSVQPSTGAAAAGPPFARRRRARGLYLR